MTAASLQDRRRAALQRLETNRRRRPKRAWHSETSSDIGPPTTGFYVIAVVLTVFVMLGLVMVLSASAVSLVHQGESPYRYFTNQLVWTCAAAVGVYVVLRVPYTFWRRLSVPLLIVSMSMMALPFMGGIGMTINESRRWFEVGPFTMQPSELLKLAAIVAAADFLARRAKHVTSGRAVIWPMLILTGVAAGACLLQGDLGTAIAMTLILLAVAYFAGLPLLPLAAFAGASGAAAVILAMSSGRRFARLTAFTNVEAEREHFAYQTYQGFLSIANGGVLGSGVGEGKGKLGYLPLAHSDFIFAVIADELGLIGVIAVLGGFALLTWFGVQTALAAPDRFGMLLAGGITAWFAAQTIINVGGVTAVMPVTGITLPFFSAGGTSLFISIMAAGLLLNVARRAR